jgi:hypothetical protein
MYSTSCSCSAAVTETNDPTRILKVLKAAGEEEEPDVTETNDPTRILKVLIPVALDHLAVGYRDQRSDEDTESLSPY